MGHDFTIYLSYTLLAAAILNIIIINGVIIIAASLLILILIGQRVLLRRPQRAVGEFILSIEDWEG